jgi:eukaryotic-like serine/threonine-protein kinase
MPIAAGTCLGPYEIVSSLGAGGMGEVYRARDPRLGRDVAVKIISGEGPPSPERLQRFEQEARAVAALQHPHILSVFDVGTHEGRAYLVFELLEGETLRERLSRGPLPARKAIEVTIQAAHGLAAAHAHGILHRDLKPENVVLGHEGVKLLDFGLAKLTEPQAGGEATEATPLATDEGIWVGTPGYVSPEQLRGLPATPRSDVFALGAVLYEMLSGQRAFKGATKADTLSAVLEHDPPPMTLGGGPVPLPLERVVRRCLEKDPDDRFQSARDVAFALDAISSGSSSESAAAVVPATPTRRWLRAGAALLVTATVLGVGFLGGRLASEKPAPTFKQLTFRRGWVDYARFAPDGRTVIYGAGWDGKPAELFQTRTDSPESRPLGLVHAKVLSISAQGQMAILLDPSRRQGYFTFGTLAVVPLAGGAPRELLERVIAADWTPDGRELCVSRVHADGEVTVELPPGTVLHRTRVSAGPLRVSRDGRLVVFFDNGAQRMVLIDRMTKVVKPLMVPGPANFWGMAWAPSGREVWFTEGPSVSSRDVYAVDLEGRRRLVYRSAGVLSLVDTASDGRALFHRALDRLGTMALLPGGRMEQDVTVYDSSVIGSLSADGRMLLLNSACEGAGPGDCAYLRRDGGDPIRVATGAAVDITPDGRSALIVSDSGELSVVPIGPGLPAKIELGALHVNDAAIVPSPRGGVIVRGRQRPEEPYSLWLIDEVGSKPRKLDVGAFATWAISPDGRYIAAKTAVDTISVVPVAGGPRRDVRVTDVNLGVSRWSADGRSVFLDLGARWPCEIHRLDLATEKVELWKRVAPPDPTGIVQCTSILPSADGRSYVYTINRSLTSLIVAEGLK